MKGTSKGVEQHWSSWKCKLKSKRDTVSQSLRIANILKD